ncbi:MAG TPA: TetR/AcrR family transcriptional regulator [Solirubrobacterales bacterium]|nr:TetR/AcrR family transcriptional regulator [Solirubrobacterales bacterium]
MHELPSRRAESAERGDDPVRAEIMEAMLAACGELGYREVAVKDVLARNGGHRVQFWQHFASKEECFALAYEAWADRLVAELLDAAAGAADWRGGMRAALVALFRFVDAQPELARALLLDADVAGDPALAQREAALQVLGERIDAARAQADPTDAPPPLTGLFVAGGIANHLSEQLTAGAAAPWQGLPELLRFATAPYFGEQAAEAEFEAAQSELGRWQAGEEPA